MIENIHLWHADRGTYFDRNVNIISWSDQYIVKLGKYNSIGRDCNFFLHANHRADWITTTSQLWGPVTPEIAEMHMNMGHPTCKGNIYVGNDVWRVLNRVQEKLTSGGFGYMNARGKVRKARAVKNFTQDIDMNTKLWALAEEFIAA